MATPSLLSRVIEYVGEFSGYIVSVEQSDRVLVAERRDSVHQGPGTVRYR